MYHPIGAAPMAPGPHPPPPDESETESEDGSKDASEDDLEDGSLEYLPAAPANAPQLSPGSAQAAPASAQVTLGEMTAATVLRILQEDVEERRHLAVDPIAAVKSYEIRDKWPEEPAWDYSLPTINHHEAVRCEVRRTPEDAWRALVREAPLIDVPSVKNGKFRVAGGAVGSVVTGAALRGDVDIFYCGADADEATRDLNIILQEMMYEARFQVYDKLVSDFLEFAECRAVIAPHRIEKTQTMIVQWGQKYDRIVGAHDPTISREALIDTLRRRRVLDCGTAGGTVKLLTDMESMRQSMKDVTMQAVKSGVLKAVHLPSFKIMRNRNAVTFTHMVTNARDSLERGCTYQIILRLYKRPEHIPLGFDLGSSAIMFGFSPAPYLVLSPIGYYAYTRGHNILDVARLSTTFNHRLNKYLRRGFGLILPHFDVQAIPQENLKYGYQQVIEMAGLGFIAYPSTHRNQISVDMPYRISSAADQADQADSDYSIDEIELYQAIQRNVRVLVEGGDNFYHVPIPNNLVLDPSDVIRLRPALAPDHIIRYYDGLPDKIWKNYRLNLQLFKMHMQDSIVGWAGQPAPRVTIEEFLEADNKHELIISTIRPRCEALVAMWTLKPEGVASSRLGQLGTISWMDVHPASQEKNYLFTGSFKPVFYNSPAEWYGKYFNPRA